MARVEEMAKMVREARSVGAASRKKANALLPSFIDEALNSECSGAPKTTVESVTQSVTDGDHQAPPKAETGVPFLFISNVVQGKLDFVGCHFVPSDYYKSLSPTRTPQRGDVLYTAVGSYGVPCIVDTDRPFCFQRHIAILRPDEAQVVPIPFLGASFERSFRTGNWLRDWFRSANGAPARNSPANFPTA